jgi:cyclopropane-fatty-acyl-phospholipid synthase
VDLTDRSASMLRGVQAGIGLQHHVLAVKLDSHGSDGSLPLRPWWTP